MNRTQLLTMIFVLLVGMGVASAKPKVAVLGLEQGDRTSTKASFEGARQITDGLRQGSKVGGAFDPSDTTRDYADEKAMAGCSSDARESEERECAKKISDTLKVGALIYGKVQLVDGKKNLQVTVWLLNVEKNAVKNTSGTISASASAADMQALGKKLYADLAGGPAPAALGGFSFKTKAKRGTVYINGEARGQIEDGEYKSPPLADGEYKIRVEAEGYKKLEDTVRVKDGKVASVDVQLEEIVKEVKPPPVDPEDKAERPVIGTKPAGDLSRTGTVSKGGGRTGWKIAAVSGFVIAAGSGVFAYTTNKTAKSEGKKALMGHNVPEFQLFPDCKRYPEDQAYADACNAAQKNVYAWTGVGVGVAIGLVGTYMGFIRGDSSSSETNASATKRARKPRFAVTPIIAPDGGGATFRLDF